MVLYNCKIWSSQLKLSFTNRPEYFALFTNSGLLLSRFIESCSGFWDCKWALLPMTITTEFFLLTVDPFMLFDWCMLSTHNCNFIYTLSLVAAEVYITTSSAYISKMHPSKRRQWIVKTITIPTLNPEYSHCKLLGSRNSPVEKQYYLITVAWNISAWKPVKFVTRYHEHF